MDKLHLLRGGSYQITPYVSINNPTIGQICDFSEERYFGVVSNLTATAYDYRLFLDDQGIDYVEVEDYPMFLMLISGFTYEDTKILIPDIHFEDLEPYVNQETGEVVLKNSNGQIIFDRLIYHEMADFIRLCHGFKRNWLVPGNKMARKILIQDEREKRLLKKDDSYKSMLEPLISALCNSSGFKYDYKTVWDLPIYTFLDSVRRIQKILHASHLANGIYSGNLDTKKMNKTQMNDDLNWMGEI